MVPPPRRLRAPSHRLEAADPTSFVHIGNEKGHFLWTLGELQSCVAWLGPTPSSYLGAGMYLAGLVELAGQAQVVGVILRDIPGGPPAFKQFLCSLMPHAGQTPSTYF
jgi:hypothetical protein